MKDSIFSLSQKMFYDISDSTPEKTGVFFADSLDYPVVKYDSKLVGIPLPRENKGRIFYEGNAFPGYESSYKTIWHLYLATIAHVAGHIKVTDYAKYQKWMQGKQKERASRVMEYIENIRVNEFLKDTYPEYHEVIARIVDATNRTVPHDRKTRDFVVKRFADTFRRTTTISIPEIEKQIQNSQCANLLEIADKLYTEHPQNIQHTFPFTEIAPSHKLVKPVTGLTLNSHGAFAGMIESLNELWHTETSLKNKMKTVCAEMAKDLHFDKLDFVPERFSEYLVVESQIGPIVRQMSSQLKHIPNAIDDSIPEDMGILEMQKAIQAIASQNASIQMFEQDDQRRYMEEWAIVVDTSSSMKIKFKDMKKLILCFAEAANDLVSKNGKWGLFCFNNNFNVVKSESERYDQVVKARIGGIEMRGLSYLPDAITLAGRMLDKSSTERKYLFVITDGLSLGYDKIDKSLEDAIHHASRKNINVVGIGIPKYKPNYFSLSVPYDEMRKLVSKFISMYTQIATSSL
ncbi:MAG: vWA domain-containing protein [Candidatus Nitrosotenuis sp.]